MLENIETFDDLKRVIYLFLLPCIFLVTLVSFVLQIIYGEYTFVFYVNSLFVGAFIIGWLLVYRKHSQRIVEYYLLWLVVVYHISAVTLEMVNHVSAIGVRTFISFSICTPFIIVLLFLAMKKWRALWVSILLLVLSMIPGFVMYSQLDACSVNSLIEHHISTAVYILVVFSVHEVFRMRGEMKTMRKQLYLDPLTQIGNRHQIDEWMKMFIEEATGDDSFSILFFDVDRFKRVNDQFGHKVGDDVLKETVRVVREEMRKEEFFGRWGGEEFIILLSATECEAYQLADRLRQTIGQYDFERVGRVTASFGVASYRQGDTVDTILMRADERLYASKKAGRNRVTGKMMKQNDD